MADAPGTCHLVGCEGKGTVDEHARKPIGCPDDFTPYETPKTCLGFPLVRADGAAARLFGICSIAGRTGWRYDFAGCAITPSDMAAAVDNHRKHCGNRNPR